MRCRYIDNCDRLDMVYLSYAAVSFVVVPSASVCLLPVEWQRCIPFPLSSSFTVKKETPPTRIKRRGCNWNRKWLVRNCAVGGRDRAGAPQGRTEAFSSSFSSPGSLATSESDIYGSFSQSDEGLPMSRCPFMLLYRIGENITFYGFGITFSYGL